MYMLASNIFEHITDMGCLFAFGASLLLLLVFSVVAVAGVLRRRTKKKYLGQFSGLLFGHRGCRLHGVNIPENSMMAFRYAADHGADGVECDVSLTKDNQVLVMHDETVDRTLEGSGRISQLTLGQIQGMPFRCTGQRDVPDTRRPAEWNTLGEAVDRAPTLEHLIEFCKFRKIKLMIELKEARKHRLIVELIAELIAKHNFYGDAYVASFNPYHLLLFRSIDPRIATCLLFCRGITESYYVDNENQLSIPFFKHFRWFRRCLDAILVAGGSGFLCALIGVDIIGPHSVLVSSELVADMKKAGVVTNMWVVNDDLERQHWQSTGVLVTTDCCFKTSAPLSESESFSQEQL